MGRLNPLRFVHLHAGLSHSPDERHKRAFMPPHISALSRRMDYPLIDEGTVKFKTSQLSCLTTARAYLLSLQLIGHALALHICCSHTYVHYISELHTRS